MRFEQPLNGVVARFPELRGNRRERTVPRIDHEEIQSAVALGRRLQARQVRAVFGALVIRPLAAFGRTAARVASYLVREYKRDRDRRSTIRELRALEDHQLLDIGLERGDIVSVAEALAGARHEAAPTNQATTEPATPEQPFEPLRAA